MALFRHGIPYPPRATKKGPQCSVVRPGTGLAVGCRRSSTVGPAFGAGNGAGLAGPPVTSAAGQSLTIPAVGDDGCTRALTVGPAISTAGLRPVVASVRIRLGFEVVGLSGATAVQLPASTLRSPPYGPLHKPHVLPTRPDAMAWPGVCVGVERQLNRPA